MLWVIRKYKNIEPLILFTLNFKAFVVFIENNRFLTGNIRNRLLQGNAATYRGPTCCKMLVRQWASRKIWSTKIPLGGGKPYLASGLLQG